ncbi:MAG: hypothetical protein HOV81_00890 [Kofleriaceae bacterium]|nr:hypothetical protein [Kofleriaceae bacterium]
MSEHPVELHGLGTHEIEQLCGVELRALMAIGTEAPIDELPLGERRLVGRLVGRGVGSFVGSLVAARQVALRRLALPLVALRLQLKPAALSILPGLHPAPVSRRIATGRVNAADRRRPLSVQHPDPFCPRHELGGASACECARRSNSTHVVRRVNFLARRISALRRAICGRIRAATSEIDTTFVIIAHTHPQRFSSKIRKSVASALQATR